MAGNLVEEVKTYLPNCLIKVTKCNSSIKDYPIILILCNRSTMSLNFSGLIYVYALYTDQLEREW